MSKTPSEGAMPPEHGRWRKAVPDQTFEDGDRILCRVPLHEDSGGGDEMAVVHVRCDEGRFELEVDGKPWGGTWADVEFWIPTKELATLGDKAQTALWLDCLVMRLEKLPEAKNPEKPCTSAIGAINRLEIQRNELREACEELTAFVGVMFGRGPDSIIPETIDTPLRIPVKIGEIMRSARAALTKTNPPTNQGA